MRLNNCLSDKISFSYSSGNPFSHCCIYGLLCVAKLTFICNIGVQSYISYFTLNIVRLCCLFCVPYRSARTP